jgi:hypothetical protein
VMKELEQLIQAWDWIKDGSAQFELSQENEMIGVNITPDTAIIDIMHPSAIDFISPFIKKNLEARMSTMDHTQERGSLLLGVLGSLSAKRRDLSKYLSLVQEIATILAENKKCVILREKGKQLIKLGHGADSMRMRMLGVNNMEVNDLYALLRIMDRIKS